MILFDQYFEFIIIICTLQQWAMDTTDAYTSRRLLFKCDNSIAKIYTNLFKMLSTTTEPISQTVEQQLKYQTVKQLEGTIFQIFKYSSALKSLQKEMLDNQQIQSQADREVENSKQEIKRLMDEVKSAEVVRRRKLQYNKIAKSVKQLDTYKELTRKIQQVESQVEKLNSQYQSDMEAYAEKQRLLRMALSALRALKTEQEPGINQSPISNT